MLKNSAKFLSILIILVSLNKSSADDIIKWTGNIYEHIHDYQVLHKKFSKKICTPGADHKYNELYREYRGSGYYLPEVNDDIDREAITKNLYHFQKKISHIQKLHDELSKKENITPFEKMEKPLLDVVNQLLELKKQYNVEVSSEKRKQLITDSKEKLKELFKLYQAFIDEYSFLQSYNFPNDHLKNRYEYDTYKDSEKVADKKRANKVFFFRRIVEDGAMNPDNTRPDVFVRTALDTIYLNMKKENDFISENVRYDVEWVLANLKSLINLSKADHLARLAEWKERTQEAYDFYSDIIKLKNKEKAKQLVHEKNQATIKLKEYTYSKQADVFMFWQKQPELMKALFVLETILYNEVGSVDGVDGLERADVVKVVLNRMKIPFYRTLEKTQPLWKYIPLSEEEIQKEHWLNVLLKIGEFSFTYHYIGASSKIFCPDMSRAGKNLRAENLKIALKTMQSYAAKFKAVRYFSRVSMRGKIDMSSVWTDFKKVEERPGYEAINNNQLGHYYLNNEYRYLYSFIDPKGHKYQVVEIKDKIYSMTWVRGRPKFFNYRNPHLFTYFAEK